MNEAIDRFLFAPLNAHVAAWLRLALAGAIPIFYWSRGFTVPSSAPPIAERVYDGIFLTSWYWLLIVGLCALLAWGRRPRPIALLLVGALAPLNLLSWGRASRGTILVALAAFSLVRSDVVRAPWQPYRTIAAGPIWPLRLMQLQLTIVYAVNAIAKTKPGYLRGDVLAGMAVALPNFVGHVRDGAIQLGPLALPLAVAAVGTVATEYFLAFGFWVKRLRWVAAVVGMIFHGVLRFMIRIHLLDLAAIFLYLSFLLPAIIDRRQRFSISTGATSSAGSNPKTRP